MAETVDLVVEEFVDHHWWHDPPPQIRPMGMTYRGLVRFLHHASAARMLDHLEYESMRERRRPGRKARKPLPRAASTKRRMR